MAKPLIIVESPAKARTIERFLGRKFIVRASMGHVRDLPRSQFGVDVEREFEPKYITIRGKGEVLKELRESARKAKEVYLATDPDREGEAIGWHLIHMLGLDGRKNRVVFREITKEAVEKAIQHPRQIDPNLVNAQQARRILDRVVGYKLSPLLWRKVRGGLSAGRVQSVAVKLICDREQEIESFKPEEYWSLTALLETREGEGFEAKYYGKGSSKAHVPSREHMDDLLRALEGRRYVVGEVKKKERKRKPAPPFTTSSMQQEAYRKLGFNVRRTMRVAQQLYEGLEVGPAGTLGLVTYIRTDSVRVSEEAQKEAKAYISSKYGREYVGGPSPGAGRKPGVQDAHEAIRPTSISIEPDAVKKYLTRDQYRLYRLIWERFLASQMSPARVEATTADILAGEHLFRATGSVIRFKGFMAVYVEGRDDETAGGEDGALLPPLQSGDELRLLELQPRQHFTQPPPRFTEATLVKTMEELGIGRPSTYAPTIETILQRGYVAREERALVPTPLGRVVVDMLAEHFPHIIDVEFTARMEAQLDKIEEGSLDWREVLRKFYGPFSEELERAEARIGEIKLPEEETDIECDKCGRKMVIKHGRYGRFLACPGFPECKNTRPLLEPAGVECPRCGAEVVIRKSRRGRRFYGCSAYPECDFVSWEKPLKRRCPECGAYMVQARKGEGPRCVRPECGYAEPREVH